MSDHRSRWHPSAVQSRAWSNGQPLRPRHVALTTATVAILRAARGHCTAPLREPCTQGCGWSSHGLPSTFELDGASTRRQAAREYRNGRDVAQEARRTPVGDRDRHAAGAADGGERGASGSADCARLLRALRLFVVVLTAG